MIKIIYVADPEGGKLTMRAEGPRGICPGGTGTSYVLR